MARVADSGRPGRLRAAGRGEAARIAGHATAVVAAAAVLAGCGVAGGHRWHSAGSGAGGAAAGVTVNPSRGLSDGQRVRVAVRGFPPYAKVFLSECADARRVSPLGCGRQLAAQTFLLTDAHGTASGRLVVRLVAASGPRGAPPVKCWRCCVLVATIGPPAGGHKVVATAVIRFGSPPPPPPAPPVVMPTNAPLTVLDRIRVPRQAWQLVAGDGALFTQAAGPTITRVDPATGRVGPVARVGAVAGMAVGGGLLWVVGQARSSQRAPLRLLALNPDTLKVEHIVALPDHPGWGGDGIAFAGGLIWVAGRRSLLAVDPATARIGPAVPLPAAAAGGFITVAADPGGASLWTSEGNPGGGPIAVQRRDPRTGAVLAAASGPVAGIGPARIAAARDHAWLAYATGMPGGYVEASVLPAGPPGRLSETPPARSPAGHEVFSNGVSVYLAGRVLWILDGMSISCAADATGRIVSQVRSPGAVIATLAPLPRGRLALLVGRDIFIVRPEPPCGH